MTILEAVGDYLQAQALGTLGTNLFLGRMPDAPDVCATVFELEGSVPHFTFGAAGRAIDRPRLQVICRAARDDYPAARDKAVAIRDKLSAVTSTTLSGIKVLRISPSGSVMPMGPDENERPLVAVNFSAEVLP